MCKEIRSSIITDIALFPIFSLPRRHHKSHPAVLDEAAGRAVGVPHVLGRQRQPRDHGRDVERRRALADLQGARGVLVLAAVVAH